MSVDAMTWAWKQQVPNHLKIVLLALADHANSDGYCWPGQDGIAEKCCIRPRTLRDSLTKLEVEGLVQRRKRRGDQGQYLSDSYHLPLQRRSTASGSAPPTAVERAHQRRSDVSTGGGPPPPNRQRTTKEPSDIHAVFDHWMRVFGLNGSTRLTDKRRTKIRARLQRFTVDDLKLAIEGVKASEFHVKGGHIDLASIFLNDERVETHMRRVKGKGHLAANREQWRDWAKKQEGAA